MILKILQQKPIKLCTLGSELSEGLSCLTITNDYIFQIVNMAGCRTRHESGNDIVGPSADLPASDLPTLRDVLAYGQFLKESSLKRNNEIALRELSKQVCADLKQVWARASHKLLAPDVVYLD